MLKAIHASEDLAATREKAIRVIEKLRGLRLSRAAELVEAAVEERHSPITPSRRSTGGGFAPTTRSSTSCARSGRARANLKLTFHLDHSAGADQRAAAKIEPASLPQAVP